MIGKKLNILVFPRNPGITVISGDVWGIKYYIYIILLIISIGMKTEVLIFTHYL